MHRYIIPAVFAVFLNLSTTKADHLRDSIGVENLKGKKVILHQVVAKDTYYSLSRRYNIPPKTIMTFNNDKFLSLGIVIKVPTELPFSGPVNNSNPSSSNANSKQPAAGANQNAASSNAGIANGTVQESVIEHAVQRRENLNMLAQKYGTTVEEIRRVNNLRTINLQIGQVLKIPASAGTPGAEHNNAATGNAQPAQTEAARIEAARLAAVDVQRKQAETARQEAARLEGAKQDAVAAQRRQADSARQEAAKLEGAKQNAVAAQRRQADSARQVAANQVTQQAASAAATARDKDPFVVHTVAGNETMYSISSKYNLTLDQLKAKNNLTTNSLYVGQKLLISGQYPVNRNADSNALPSDSDSLGSVKNPSLRLPASRYGLSQVDEKGMGIFITEPDLDPSKMLVLHRTAPVGTIMKISSPMSNRSTFAKVVGKFTENESTKDVIIVMTKAVADALGALDKRFLCNLTYSAEANE